MLMMIMLITPYMYTHTNTAYIYFVQQQFAQQHVTFR